MENNDFRTSLNQVSWHLESTTTSWDIHRIQTYYLGHDPKAFQLNVLCHDTSWYFMIFHDISWYFMVFHDISWYFMVFHDISWYFMVFHGFHGNISRISLTFHVISMGFSWQLPGKPLGKPEADPLRAAQRSPRRGHRVAPLPWQRMILKYFTDHFWWQHVAICRNPNTYIYIYTCIYI